MTGEDIFRALSEIDDELLVLPRNSALRVQKGKTRKILTVLLVAAIAMLVLCGFGYASRLDMTYEEGVLKISVYNPNVVEEYEQWSMGYIAEGYEITKVSETMWLVFNGSHGFYLSQMPLSEDASTIFESEIVEVTDEVEELENIISLNDEFLKNTRNFYWKSKNCIYRIFVLGRTGQEAELVAMIQSITP